MFGKKKDPKKIKNQTKTFIDGKIQDEVPDKIPELEIPTPPAEEKVQQPLSAQEVYDEGRSVGFQEGLIYSLNLIQDNLSQHQAELRKKLAEKQKR